jgi:hypothetical protein
MWVRIAAVAAYEERLRNTVMTKYNQLSQELDRLTQHLEYTAKNSFSQSAQFGAPSNPSLLTYTFDDAPPPGVFFFFVLFVAGASCFNCMFIFLLLRF